MCDICKLEEQKNKTILKNDMVYKAAMTSTKEELAGMYSLALKREQELEKENARLREALEF